MTEWKDPISQDGQAVQPISSDLESCSKEALTDMLRSCKMRFAELGVEVSGAANALQILGDKQSRDQLGRLKRTRDWYRGMSTKIGSCLDRKKRDELFQDEGSRAKRFMAVAKTKLEHNVWLSILEEANAQERS